MSATMLQRVRPLGGVIRLYASGPEWHVNSTHVPMSMDTTVQPRILSSGDIEFVVDDDAIAVVGVVVGADETLAARGVTAGPSGGINTTAIRMHHKTAGRLYLNTAADYALVSGDTCNLWIVGHVIGPVPPAEPDPLTLDDPDLEAMVDTRAAERVAQILDSTLPGLVDERVALALASPAAPPTTLAQATYDDMASLRRADILHLRELTDQALATPPPVEG